MRERHPPPRAGDNSQKETFLIAPASLASAPSLTVVQEALRSFAPDSAAGPSGLRPQRIKGGLLPGFGDDVMRSIHAPVWTVAEGNIPGPVISWIASGSLTAEKKEGRRPPAGETLRCLTAKALLETFPPTSAAQARDQERL